MEDSTQSLSITDLAMLKRIIDISCERGAIRADEMKTVGDVYNRLSLFLDSVVAQAEIESNEKEK